VRGEESRLALPRTKKKLLISREVARKIRVFVNKKPRGNGGADPEQTKTLKVSGGRWD